MSEIEPAWQAKIPAWHEQNERWLREVKEQRKAWQAYAEHMSPRWEAELNANIEEAGATVAAEAFIEKACPQGLFGYYRETFFALRDNFAARELRPSLKITNDSKFVDGHTQQPKEFWFSLSVSLE